MIDTLELLTRIPHRHPILLVDRVLAVQPGVSLTATKVVSVTEFCYRQPVGAAPLTSYRYPRPLMLESLAQAAVVLATWDRPNPDVHSGKLQLAASLRGVRHLRSVYPGDVLEHHITLHTMVGDTVVIGGVTTVGGTPVLEVDQFVLAMRDVADFATA
jgi:3-hydroxyacyl-[acyl-carrier-protein] dehydratase